MTIGDTTSRLQIITDIVPVFQRGILEEFLDTEAIEWGIDDFMVCDEYDCKYEKDSGVSHVYYIIYLKIPFRNITSTLDSIILNMKSKNTVIKYVKIQDQYISTEGVQHEQ